MLARQDLGQAFYTFAHLFISWECKDEGQRGCSQRVPAPGQSDLPSPPPWKLLYRTHGEEERAFQGQLRLAPETRGSLIWRKNEKSSFASFTPYNGLESGVGGWGGVLILSLQREKLRLTEVKWGHPGQRWQSHELHLDLCSVSLGPLGETGT